MEVKLFYRTQRDVSLAINELVDSYWSDSINEQELIEGVQSIYQYNPDKLIKENQFTKVVQQQSGKRRLAVIKRILEME